MTSTRWAPWGDGGRVTGDLLCRFEQEDTPFVGTAADLVDYLLSTFPDADRVSVTSPAQWPGPRVRLDVHGEMTVWAPVPAVLMAPVRHGRAPDPVTPHPQETTMQRTDTVALTAEQLRALLWNAGARIEGGVEGGKYGEAHQANRDALVAAGLVERWPAGDEHCYRLTRAGSDFLGALFAGLALPEWLAPWLPANARPVVVMVDEIDLLLSNRPTPALERVRTIPAPPLPTEVNDWARLEMAGLNAAMAKHKWNDTQRARLLGRRDMLRFLIGWTL